MPQFRKKPVTIDAVQWTGANLREIIDFIGRHHSVTSCQMVPLTLTNVVSCASGPRSKR